MKPYLNFVMVFVLLTVFHVPVVKAEVAPFEVSGDGAILMEQESGRVLYGKEEDEPMRIASITKIMTAILAIESGKMHDTVKVSQRAAATEGSSLYLKPGEEIELRHLVYGLMLRSGNDSAVAIAEHVGGSVEGFVFLMNEKAKEIGMEKTAFANPHGLDDHEKHYSTAKDMAILMQYAMKNEEFQEISGTKTYRAPQEGEPWDRSWKNKNKLLTEKYEYCIGGKTGYTKRAGRTLVTAAEKDGMQLIAVTLDAPADWNDHIRMYEWGFDQFTMENLAQKGEYPKINDSFYDGKVQIPRQVKYPLSEKEKSHVKKRILLHKPTDEETFIPPQPVGKIEWIIDGEVFESLPLYYRDDEESTDGQGWKKLLPRFLIRLLE